MVKPSLDAEANSNVLYQVFRWPFSEGWLYDFENAKYTQTRRSATTRYRPKGDRGARGSSGSCSANGPGGCRIFASYCCSVRVRARGQLCGLTSRQHLKKKYLAACPDRSLRSGRNTPSAFRNRTTTPLKNANEYIEHCCLLLHVDSVLPFYHTHCLEINVTSAS